MSEDRLPVSRAAEAKGYTGQTIRKAIERGALNAAEQPAGTA